MNSLYTAMENTMARLVLCFNLGQLSGNGAAGLFSCCSQARLDFDSRIVAVGSADIDNTFKVLEGKYKNSGERSVIFTASPVYWVGKEADSKYLGYAVRHKETGRECGQMSCDAYVYTAYEADNIHKCQLRIMRIDAYFLWEHTRAALLDFKCYTIQTMVPWEYDVDILAGQYQDFEFLPSLEQREIESDTYIELKKLGNGLWDRLLQNIEDHFATRTAYQDFIDYFSGDKLREPIIGMSGMPWISRESGKSIGIRTIVEVFQRKDIHRNNSGQIDTVVSRSFHLIYIQAEDRGGLWKISQTEWKPLLELPNIGYLRGHRYDKISHGLLPWTLFNSPLPGRFVPDSYEIENIINAWVYACRRGRLAQFYKEYMDNRLVKPKMLIKSQGDRSAELTGSEAILQRLCGMDENYVNRMYSFHTATTPVIEISADGTFARGTWYDHSATNLGSEARSLYEIPYMVFVARYVHEFRKIDGRWYLISFFWEPLLSMEDWIFDLPHSEGWVNNNVTGEYPEAFYGLL